MGYTQDNASGRDGQADTKTFPCSEVSELDETALDDMIGELLVVEKSIADQIAKTTGISAGAQKLEELYALTAEERDEEIAELKTDEQRLQGLSDARFDDETVHTAEFWFGADTIWDDMIGSTLWDTMVNRYPLALAYLLPHLMAAIVPVGINIELPNTVADKADADAPRVAATLWCMANADSGKGKGPMASVMQSMTDAVNTINAENTKLIKAQRQSNARVNKERSKSTDATTDLDLIDDSPGKMNPAILVESLTVPALRSAIGSTEFWHDNADEFGFNYTGRGVVISATEGDQVIKELEILHDGSSNTQSLCSWWSGESKGAVLRKTDFENTVVTRPAVSLAFTLIPEQFRAVIAMETRPGKTAGFTPRVVSIAGEKDREKQAPGRCIVKPTRKSRSAPKLHIHRDALIRAFKLMSYQLLEQGAIELSDAAYAVFGTIEKLVDANQLVTPDFNSKYWVSVCDKNSQNLTKLACAFALMRISAIVSTGVECPIIEIEISDIDRAMVILNLSLADRRYQLTQISTAVEQVAIVESTKRSLKQNEDVWYQRFSCPKSTKAWIAECKAAGKDKRASDKSVAGTVKKRLRERYQIEVTKIINDLW